MYDWRGNADAYFSEEGPRALKSRRRPGQPRCIKTPMIFFLTLASSYEKGPLILHIAAPPRWGTRLLPWRSMNTYLSFNRTQGDLKPLNNI